MPPTVLIIEDDADMRLLEQTALESSGFVVAAAGNGREALRWLERRTPCVILLDLMMPVMDGLSFLRARQEAAGSAANVPVICVSAAGDDMLTEARRLGAAECLQKPSDLDHLCEVVERYCRLRIQAPPPVDVIRQDRRKVAPPSDKI